MRSLSQLSFVNMKNLFGREELVQPRGGLGDDVAANGAGGAAEELDDSELFDDYDDPIKY